VKNKTRRIHKMYLIYLLYYIFSFVRKADTRFRVLSCEFNYLCKIRGFDGGNYKGDGIIYLFVIYIVVL
jgi:hypothetical protein